METHRFAVDVMLGRLATWLRLIGQDAAYGPHLAGRTLLRMARSEGRIVLTRDLRLARRAAGVPVLLIAADGFRDQLAQVVAAFRIDPYRAILSRCVRCNTILRQVSADKAAPCVPAYVARTQPRFMRCDTCGRFYWPGTHHERIQAELRAMGFAES